MDLLEACAQGDISKLTELIQSGAGGTCHRARLRATNCQLAKRTSAERTIPIPTPSAMAKARLSFARARSARGAPGGPR